MDFLVPATIAFSVGCYSLDTIRKLVSGDVSNFGNLVESCICTFFYDMMYLYCITLPHGSSILVRRLIPDTWNTH